MLLTNSQVSIDTRVTGGTGQVLVLAVWNMEMGLWVAVFLGQTKIDNIDLVATLANTHQEIVRLDIAVDEGFGVDVLDTRDKLVGQKQYSLQGEFSIAEIEQVLQTRSKQIKDHGIVVTFCPKPADEGNTDTSSE